VKIGTKVKHRARLSELPVGSVVVNCNGFPILIKGRGTLGLDGDVDAWHTGSADIGNPPYTIVYVGLGEDV
jgi:hypothetical protein